MSLMTLFWFLVKMLPWEKTAFDFSWGEALHFTLVNIYKQSGVWILSLMLMNYCGLKSKSVVFKLLCGVCYRPPNQSAEAIDKFLTCFQESLDLIFSTSEFSAVFILGDFNAHFSFNETSAPNTDIGLNLLIFCGLCNKTLNLFHGANFNYLGFVAFAKAYNCHLHPTVFVCWWLNLIFLVSWSGSCNFGVKWSYIITSILISSKCWFAP
jgi:hypothetical protein